MKTVELTLPGRLKDTELFKDIGWSPYEPLKNPMQMDVMEHFYQCKEHFVMCGRQVGKSMLGAYLALRELLTPNTATWVVAPEYDLTKRIWDYLERWVSKGFDEVIKINRSSLTMTSVLGSTLECKSTETGNLIGKSLSGLIIDEAARIPEQIWWADLHPTLDLRNGFAFLISTPKGKNWFYEEWRREDPRRRSYRYPSSSSPYYPEEALEHAKATMPERIFSQEHLANPEEEGGSVFPIGLIQPCITGQEQPPNPFHRYIIGIDFAKYEDFTVAMVIDQMTNELVHMLRMNQLDYPVQVERLLKLIRAYTPNRVIADNIGVGAPLCDQLRKDGVNLEAVSFRGFNKKGKPGKNDLIEFLRMAFTKRWLKIPNLKVLIDELTAFTYTQRETERGLHTYYSAPKGQHDDCVLSLAMATWLISPTPQTEAKKLTPSLTPSQRYLKEELDALSSPDSVPLPEQETILDLLEWG